MPWIARIEQWLQAEHTQSEATRAAYLADMRLLADLIAPLSLAQVDARVARGLVRKLHARGDDPASSARRLSAWRVCCRYLLQCGELSANPFEAVRAPRRARKLPHPLGPDATQQFLDAMPDDDTLALRDRAAFELIYSGGLRVSELVRLDLADFHDELRLVQVLGKGGKSRMVPVGEQARTALADWLAVRSLLPGAGTIGAVFLSQQGARLSVRSIQARLDAWGKQLGVADHLHPHKLRHACASHFLQSSQDLRATQELLGHSSIASTQVYTHLDFQHLASVYDAAHPRAHRNK
ncbi:tyrosine recombinase XerC [Burkholderiaceae bacterium DAT-1]|nr:tyrosine recombinase XerC [Burkholderiaceae bacterium DAT-1]